MSDPKINIQNVSRTFGARGRKKGGGFTALSDVNLTVRDGEFLCIVGPSGCGKSTLLRMLGGLDRPTEGKITLRHADGGRVLDAMIFQQESVFPWMTVADNAAYGLRTAGQWKGAESQEVVDHFLQITGLSKFRDFYPSQLSGGMKQRLAIARAFATAPEVLLMDEPFAALDEQNKHLLQSELARLWEEHRSTVVFITHGLEEAVFLGDRVAVMSSAPGRIVEDIAIPFERPRDLAALKRDPEFTRITDRLWTALHDEVIAARDQETARLARQKGADNG